MTAPRTTSESKASVPSAVSAAAPGTAPPTWMSPTTIAASPALGLVHPLPAPPPPSPPLNTWLNSSDSTQSPRLPATTRDSAGTTAAKAAGYPRKTASSTTSIAKPKHTSDPTTLVCSPSRPHKSAGTTSRTTPCRKPTSTPVGLEIDHLTLSVKSVPKSACQSTIFLFIYKNSKYTRTLKYTHA